MRNIAIIGAGQIGSRHLQALANFKETASVQIVDPSEESLKIAQDRFLQVSQSVPKQIELICHKSIDTLFETIDVAIVATYSNIRAGVIKALTHKKEIKNFILEKVLFQSVAEYFEIDELLKKKNIPTWVNCYMRSRGFYQKLRDQICMTEEIVMTVEGTLWGIGCNSIHYIDCFSYLTGCHQFDVVDCHLDKKIIESKRSGFKEFSGRLAGKNSQGDSLILVCHDKGNDPVKININNGAKRHEITEHVDHVVYRLFNEGKQTVKKVAIPFQSQITHHLIHQIFNHGECDLTRYHDSMNLHLPLVKTLIKHLYNLTGNDVQLCPIT